MKSPDISEDLLEFDIPNTSEEYIHRIGRTARASAEGDAITFVCPDEYMALRTIESALGKNLPQEPWEGSVPVISLFKPAGSAPPRTAPRRGRHLLRRG